MKVLFLPLTFLLVALSGAVLITAALISTLFSLLASAAAYLIIRIVVWQESEVLVKFTTFLGSQKFNEETK